MEPGSGFQEEPWEELVNGVCVALSSCPSIEHNTISDNIFCIFAGFLRKKPDHPFSSGTDLYLTSADRFVPDGMVVCDPDKVKRDGVHGAPDLVVEVLSFRTASRDRGYKKSVYERCGVREYWIVDPAGKSVEQYLLRDGRLELNKVHAIVPDWELERMDEAERAEVTAEFRCGIFGDLVIHLEDVFDRTL